jgi:two-component system, NarL family, response regulator YdfI
MRVEAATETVAGLARHLSAARERAAGEAVIVARLEAPENELPELIAEAPRAALVVLAADASQLALPALRAGARGVLGLHASAETIGAAVASVTRGLLTMPAGAAGRLEPRSALSAQPEPLTPREIEILGLLASGDSNKTIAARLCISVHTVKFHISSVLAKLGVSTRTEAVALGLKLGIVML